MGLIQAFDSGRYMGWALCQNGLVTHCGLVEVLDDQPLRIDLYPGSITVVEYPVHRGHGNQVDPNDLIRLGGRACRVQERALLAGCKTHLIKPGRWKGSVPKTIHHGRIKEALTEQERRWIQDSLLAVAEKKRHNVWDAVGLAKWAHENRDRL